MQLRLRNRHWAFDLREARVHASLLYRCIVPWWHIDWPRWSAWRATFRRYRTHAWEYKSFAYCVVFYIVNGGD